MTGMENLRLGRARPPARQGDDPRPRRQGEIRGFHAGGSGSGEAIIRDDV
jgi:hypothetical protein